MLRRKAKSQTAAGADAEGSEGSEGSGAATTKVPQAEAPAQEVDGEETGPDEPDPEPEAVEPEPDAADDTPEAPAVGPDDDAIEGSWRDKVLPALLGVLLAAVVITAGTLVYDRFTRHDQAPPTPANIGVEVPKFAV